MMNRKKQIKKVSKARQEYLKFKPFADDLRKAESWCELDGVLNRYQTVKNLSKMGYRKAPEVAREIFAEISKASADWGCYYMSTFQWGYVTSDVIHTLADLKKKYTEEGK